MSSNLQGNPSANADIGQINPQLVNTRLLKDISEIIEPIISHDIPEKRSGFSNSAYVIFQVCIQILLLSPYKVAELMENVCKENNLSFQKYEMLQFSNDKKRRFFPDQPSLSRYFKRLEKLNCVEEFWNHVQLAHLLYLKDMNMLTREIKMIADYTETPCVKNLNDPYCFGKKDGKTKHKTLTFSIISGDLHQMIGNYKIRKKQDKLVIFQEVIDILKKNGFTIVYALLDRGFYRKRLLSFLKQQGITVIMPGRKCAQTAKKIANYLMNKGKRYCKGFLNLNYVKKKGFPKLNFDLLLVAKRKFTLKEVKSDLKSNKITLIEASKRIFPLIVMFGKNGGIRTLRGNESYIRDLYRRRWWIEIAFREMNRLGISNNCQNRDVRLGILGIKSLLYNIWQVQRFLIKKDNPQNDALTLDEFLGKCYNKRYPIYLSCMA